MSVYDFAMTSERDKFCKANHGWSGPPKTDKIKGVLHMDSVQCNLIPCQTNNDITTSVSCHSNDSRNRWPHYIHTRCANSKLYAILTGHDESST